MGLVYVRDLKVPTRIGVEARERRVPQEVVVAIDMEADLAAAASSDDLAHAVDYAAVAALVREHAAAAEFRLLEAFAGSIASLLLERFPLVRAATVEVEKPQAVPGARVGVRLHREREPQHRRTAEEHRRA